MSTYESLTEDRKRLKDIAINNAISYWTKKGNKENAEYFKQLKQTL